MKSVLIFVIMTRVRLFISDHSHGDRAVPLSSSGASVPLQLPQRYAASWECLTVLYVVWFRTSVYVGACGRVCSHSAGASLTLSTSAELIQAVVPLLNVPDAQVGEAS